MNYYGLLFSVALALSLPAQAVPTVHIVADLLARFDPGRVTDSTSCLVREPANAGGVAKDALYEHPLTPARPARVAYELELPPAGNNERILLAFDIALADGIAWGKGEDGVRFEVEVEGKRLFSRDWMKCQWQPHAVDLTPYAGRRVSLALLTGAIGNTSHDWALWGRPRVLHFQAGSAAAFTASAPGQFATPIVTGAFALQYRPGEPLKVRLTPRGAGSPIEWNAPVAKFGDGMAWLVMDFNYPRAEGVEATLEPAVELPAGCAYLGAYPAQLVLRQVSATRALINAGETIPLRVEIKNEGQGRLNAGAATVQLRAGAQPLSAQALPALVPGETWHGDWSWPAPADADQVNLSAQLQWNQKTASISNRLDIMRPSSVVESLTNSYLKLEFVRQADGFAFARVFARDQAVWTQTAVWTPLFGVAGDFPGGENLARIRPTQVTRSALPGGGEALEFTGTSRSGQAAWQVKLRVELPPDRPLARVRYEWQPGSDVPIRALYGPNLYVGDGTSGDAKTWGLFPGLEYLYGAEPSSNPRDFAPKLADRRTPHPHKITVPLMAITLGPDSQASPPKPARFFAPDSLKDQSTPRAALPAPRAEVTVGLYWDPLQRWDGEHAFPSPRFASPNFDESMRNHRFGIFLPSAPEFMPENGVRADKPFIVRAGKALTLEASLVVAPGPAVAAIREWLRDRGGLPQPNPWPRSFQRELDVCRASFLKTVWNEKTEKWRHCIDWVPSHAPGYAALLWRDSQVAESADARRQSRERVELAAKNMLRDGGPGLFTSAAGCHIMQWEFPFHYGCLPEALAGLENQIRNLIKSQRPDGGWVYHPANAEQADLGQAGDSVLGTCAPQAAMLLRYARITGDPAALAAGEKALRFMENFRVPRGGQTWECPMYEPDILASAYAIRAYHEAYLVTGNPRWLHNAVYWAETGVPFLYLWTLPDKPMMLGATIPVFGSTFYTHSWLAVPVQWCGLVYAYHVLHLAETLERTPLPATDSPLPLALNFSTADWKRIVELITVSGMYQQYDEGDRLGTYPDSISRFEQRNPAFINPEDILVNLLALKGYDPDVQTARTGGLVVSSGAKIQRLQTDAQSARFQLAGFAGEPSHTLVAGFKPGTVRINGQPLATASAPLKREPGWWWDDQRQRLYLTIPHSKPETSVELIR